VAAAAAAAAAAAVAAAVAAAAQNTGSCCRGGWCGGRHGQVRSAGDRPRRLRQGAHALNATASTGVALWPAARPVAVAAAGLSDRGSLAAPPRYRGQRGYPIISCRLNRQAGQWPWLARPTVPRFLSGGVTLRQLAPRATPRPVPFHAPTLRFSRHTASTSGTIARPSGAPSTAST
jgi:hypothetical protein